MKNLNLNLNPFELSYPTISKNEYFPFLRTAAI